MALSFNKNALPDSAVALQILANGREIIFIFFGGNTMNSIKYFAALASTITMALALPASAGTIIMTGSDGTSGVAGVVRGPFSDGSGISVQASAFSFNGGNALANLSTGYLGRYGSGLGVTNGNEGNGGSNSHITDNVGGTDFILLVFNKAVNLTSAVLNPFSTDGSKSSCPANPMCDNDAFVTYGTIANAYQAVPTAVSLANVLALANNANGKNVAGNMGAGYSTGLNSPNAFANVWIIGASRSNYNVIDGKSDGFKLYSVNAVAQAVPEPATWGMMIGGMGIAGMTLRRRRRAAIAQIMA
jgi:hypothetical protein